MVPCHILYMGTSLAFNSQLPSFLSKQSTGCFFIFFNKPKRLYLWNDHLFNQPNGWLFCNEDICVLRKIYDPRFGDVACGPEASAGGAQLKSMTYFFSPGIYQQPNSSEVKGGAPWCSSGKSMTVVDRRTSLMQTWYRYPQLLWAMMVTVLEGGISQSLALSSSCAHCLIVLLTQGHLLDIKSVIKVNYQARSPHWIPLSHHLIAGITDMHWHIE